MYDEENLFSFVREALESPSSTRLVSRCHQCLIKPEVQQQTGACCSCRTSVWKLGLFTNVMIAAIVRTSQLLTEGV